MSDSTSKFVSPAALYIPSPSPSTSSHSRPSSPSPEPPRKRARSEITPEERKEARAHRNRLAAQNSRDKRKAHFSYLEQRVAELENENRQLRAGMGLAVTAPAPLVTVPMVDERDKAREQENEELRERIRILEKGWDAVVKALAAQGLPTGLLAPDSTQTSQTSTQDAVKQSPPTPVLAPSYPSPAPTLSPTLSFADPLSDSTSSSLFSPTFDFPTTSAFEHEMKDLEEYAESTRHSARVATVVYEPTTSLQRVDSASAHSAPPSLPQSRQPAHSPRPSRNSPRSTQLWKTSSVRSSPHLRAPRRRFHFLLRPQRGRMAARK